MRRRSRGHRAPAPGLLLLGACTLWLVIQNTLLVLGLLWLEPRKAVTLAIMLCKAAIVVISGFWLSPAAPLLVGVVLIVGLIAPILMGRATTHEVIHG
jgi:hypothetical protein